MQGSRRRTSCHIALTSCSSSATTRARSWQQFGGTVVERPSLAFDATVSTGIGCGTSNQLTLANPASVTYCYRVTNTGAFTLTTHTLTDTITGAILTNQPLTLTPGQSAVVTRSVALSASAFNAALWTATPVAGTVTSAPSWTRVVIGAAPPAQFVYLPLIVR